MATPTRMRTARPRIDATCAAAVELGRTAVEEIAEPGHVGDHLGVEADDDRVVTHFFACRNPAYRNWRWAATLARAPRSRQVTVDEVALVPGPDALLPPEWLPWSARVRAGDLGVGDLLVTPLDDERLVPGYAPVVTGLSALGAGGGDAQTVDALGSGNGAGDEDRAVAWELGLGRPRVLSLEGRRQAADRWYSGQSGPTAPIALAAPARCASCGFLTQVAGVLRQVFGICANEYAPDDGRVVSLDHGCGAHSEVALAARAAGSVEPVVDELGYDVLAAPPAAAGPAAAARPSGHPPGSVDGQEPAEDLGHS